MRIYNGWVLSFWDGKEYTVKGSMKIRGNQCYILRANSPTSSMIRNPEESKFSIARECLLDMLHKGTVKYVRSVSP